MREFIGHMLITIMSASLFLLGVLGCISNAEEGKLDQRFVEIRSQNMGVGTDWGELEIECLKLLKKFDSPEDKGEIYATVAFIYSDKGYNPLAGDITGQLSKTIEYCKKALEYPLNVVTACQIYSSWADALQIKYRNTDGGKFATARRQIIIPCLEGLKLILDNKVPEKRQPPPPRC